MEIKEQKSKLDEQIKIYTKIDKYTSNELKYLDELLSSIDINNSEDYKKKMQFACVLVAYIKRRSNESFKRRRNIIHGRIHRIP